MQRLVEKLREDHINMRRLLQLFDSEIRQLRDPASDPDYHFLHDVLRYFIHYPDVLHHPTEELLFVFLANRRPELATAIRRLGDQHGRHGQSNQYLYSLLDGVCSEHIVSRSVLLQHAEQFLNEQLAHMTDEEDIVFASSEHHFSNRDWVQIEHRIQIDTDPVFGAQIDEEFARLRDAMFETAMHAHVA